MRAEDVKLGMKVIEKSMAGQHQTVLHAVVSAVGDAVDEDWVYIGGKHGGITVPKHGAWTRDLTPVQTMRIDGNELILEE